MAGIPPNWLGSAIGAQQAQARALEERARESADESRRAQGTQGSGELIQGVEDTAEVDADAQGSGSQGRAFSDAQPEENPDGTNGTPPTGDGHIDVQA